MNDAHIAATVVNSNLEWPHVSRDTVVLLASRLGMGGAERHTIALANLLAGHFRVVVAYLKPEEDMIGLLHQPSLVELRCLNATKRIDMRAARDLADLANKHGARAIVCANAFALMYAQLARMVSPTRLTVVEVFHTTKLRTLKEHLEMVFYRPFFWAADHLVFVCDGQRRYWQRRGLWSRSSHMIYNGVDLAHFDPSPARRVRGRRSDSTQVTASWASARCCAPRRPTSIC
jgi:glycosyltransferase involved in cell wall biosynthesis